MADPRALTRVVDELLWSLRRGGFDRRRRRRSTSLRRGARGRPRATGGRARGARRRRRQRDARAARASTRRSTRSLRRAAPHEGTLLGAARAPRLHRRRARRGCAISSSASRRAARTAARRRLGRSSSAGAELDRLLHLAGIARTLDADREPASARLLLPTASSASSASARAPRRPRAPARALPRRARRRARRCAGRRARARSSTARPRTCASHVRERLAAPRRRARGGAAIASPRDHRVHGADRRRGRGGPPRRPRASPSASAAASASGAAARAHGRVDPAPHAAPRARARAASPSRPPRKRRRRDKPRLVLLCDVSDSVRAAARFMLELIYAAQELFDRTRSFVFVSELGETTRALRARARRGARSASAYGGGVVSVGRQLELRPRPSHLRGARTSARSTAAPPSSSSATAARTTTTTPPRSSTRIRARAARPRLALPRAARPVAPRRQRDAALRAQGQPPLPGAHGPRARDGRAGPRRASLTLAALRDPLAPIARRLRARPIFS